PEFAGTFRRLFTERNERWVEALIDYLSTESAYFIVVGAGHLVGDGSVIDLLEQAGYPSVRIRTPDDL
ncbi:MAG: TraB/GumN family protein, partial [Spirochaetota bacterium]